MAVPSLYAETPAWKLSTAQSFSCYCPGSHAQRTMTRMHVELRLFEKGDLALLETWTQRIHAEQYMSRTRPLDHAHLASGPADGLLWFVIRVDGADAGTVWLEREGAGSARLGILLGDESLLGLGIGALAVRLAVARAGELSVDRVALHVRTGNERAIACYAKCGFVPVERRVKRGGDGSLIEFLRMELRLERT
jgi:RimJ/RimL family protein N-acetyltransferase